MSPFRVGLSPLGNRLFTPSVPGIVYMFVSLLLWGYFSFFKILFVENPPLSKITPPTVGHTDFINIAEEMREKSVPGALTTAPLHFLSSH